MAQLKDFGVTTYGARAYLALLELGVAEARGVSELANIPSAKVYGALVQLQRRGLAEVTPGKPRKYTPVPIADFLERQLQQREDESADLRGRMEHIVALFPVKGDAAVGARPQTVTIEGKRNIMQHLREACQEATGSIHALMSPVLRADLTLRRPLEEAARRGVSVELVEDPSPHDPASLAATYAGDPILPANPTSPTASFVATFDDRAALLIRFARGRRKEGQESAAIHTTDPGFVAPLRHLLLFHGALRRGVGKDAPPEVAKARLDPTTFQRLVDEQARVATAASSALLHVSAAAELDKDHLWLAARNAAKARVLLSPTSSHPPEPTIAAQLHPDVEVKFLPAASAVAFAILDGQRAFFVSPTREKPQGPVYAMTADAAIVRAFEAQFDAHWAKAIPIQRPSSP